MNQKDFILIGHITRDIAPNGEFIPGGPVTYAGITLAQRGHTVQILTKSAQNDPLLDVIRNYGIDILNFSQQGDIHTTTYTNMYDELQNRTQYVSDVAEEFHQKDLDTILSHSEGKRTMILPVANEIPSTFYEPLSALSEILIAAPQGSLRRWDADGKVYHEQFSEEYIKGLSFADIITLSNEDVEGFNQESLNNILYQENATVFLTNGRDGAHMFHNNEITDVPPFRLDYETEEQEGYPTGNGDHMTAIIAENAPSPFGKYVDPAVYKDELYQAAAKGALLTALKIMKREGVTDGVGSIRTPSDIINWTRKNRIRVQEYAELCKLDPSVFIQDLETTFEGNINHFYRK